MNRIFFVLWPSFIAAGVAEIVFFTLIDPQELYLLGQVVHFSKVATYSIGFFGFWAACAVSSMMTFFLQRSAAEVNRGSKLPVP